MFEGLVRPFQTIQTILPEPAKGSVPLPGEGSEAFISWGGPSSFQNLPPNEDLTADDQCSSGFGVRQTIYDAFFDGGVTAPDAPTQAGPATSGTRAAAEPTDVSGQTLAQYWSAEGWSVSGSGDFWTADPATKTVIYYATEAASLQAREDLNTAKQVTRSNNTDPTTGPVSITLLTRKKKKKKPQDQAPGVFSFDEIDRYEEAYTVYKPNDNSVYVNVSRPLSIRFRGPKGEILKFNYKPPEPPERPAGPNPPK